MHPKIAAKADISKYRNVHLLCKNDVGYLVLNPGWCPDGHCGASVWVVEHWSVHVECWSTARSHVMAPV